MQSHHKLISKLKSKKLLQSAFNAFLYLYDDIYVKKKCMVYSNLLATYF